MYLYFKAYQKPKNEKINKKTKIRGKIPPNLSYLSSAVCRHYANTSVACR